VGRYVKGVLRGVSAPVGTILGPNRLGELMAVVEERADGVALGYATTPEIQAALTQPEPRSLTELQLRRHAGRD